jgi:endonuclease/exonuclease/phosphatase family metal-dependent hydrolase
MTHRRTVLLALVVVLLAVAAVVVVVQVHDGGSPRGGPRPTATPSSPSSLPSSTAPPTSPSSPADHTFVVATFNVLGNSHTSATGKDPGLASGAARTPAVVRLLEEHHVDLVGLQELQRPQADAFRRLTAGTWDVFSDPADTENSVAWRRDRWLLVSARTFPVPYFSGRPKPMPLVRLRDRVTGRELYVLDVHNPADHTRYFRHQSGYRAVAVRREVALVRRLATPRVPVLLLGDMNDRSRIFCPLTRHGLMTSASGGDPGPPCRPRADAGIDWVFGTLGLRFSDYLVDRSPRHDGTSDHPIVVTRAGFRH